MTRIFLLLCSLLITGCDAVNCIINNHPEFSKNSVNSATLNQVFEDSIRASISNSFEDLEYSYSFDLAGDLPEGISYAVSGRTITFTGTPTELGDFPFKLSVTATISSTYPSEDDPEALCSDTESREMVLSVVQRS